MRVLKICVFLTLKVKSLRFNGQYKKGILYGIA